MDVIEKTESRLVLQESTVWNGAALLATGIYSGLTIIIGLGVLFLVPGSLFALLAGNLDPFNILETAVGIGIILFGAVKLLEVKKTKITVEKGRNLITVTDSDPLGRKEDYEYEINGLQAVEVETEPAKRGKITYYNINLVFKGGGEKEGGAEEAEKETIYDRDDESEAEAAGKQIADFAGLKYSKKGCEDPIGKMVTGMVNDGLKKIVGGI